MAKINEIFLKSILTSKEIEKENVLVTELVREMSQYIFPELITEDSGDYKIYYRVKYEDFKNLDIDESQVFALKQKGWELDETGQYVINVIG